MERALRESEERFRTIVENSQDWIWENERRGRITYSNGAIEHILGYSPEELIGSRRRAHAPRRPRRSWKRAHAASWSPKARLARWRLRWLHRDGSERVLESTAHPRNDEQAG